MHFYNLLYYIFFIFTSCAICHYTYNDYINSFCFNIVQDAISFLRTNGFIVHSGQYIGLYYITMDWITLLFVESIYRISVSRYYAIYISEINGYAQIAVKACERYLLTYVKLVSRHVPVSRSSEVLFVWVRSRSSNYGVSKNQQNRSPTGIIKRVFNCYIQPLFFIAFI